jgi:hypothetical protein
MLARRRRQSSQHPDLEMQPAKEANPQTPVRLLNETLDQQDFGSHHKHVAVTQSNQHRASRKEYQVTREHAPTRVNIMCQSRGNPDCLYDTLICSPSLLGAKPKPGVDNLPSASSVPPQVCRPKCAALTVCILVSVRSRELSRRLRSVRMLQEAQLAGNV